MTEQCIDRAMPLSSAQRHRWFLQEEYPELPIHTAPVLFRLRGTLDLPRLRTALHSLVAATPALRTVVTSAGQYIVDGWAPPLPVVDAAGEPEAILADLVVREQRRRLGAAGEPPVRAVLARFSPADHALMISAHRALIDDRSRSALLRELAAHYGGKFTSDTQVTRSAPDSGYWLEKLAGVPATLALPADRPHRTNLDFRSDKVEFELPGGLRELSGGSPFTAALAGLQAVFARYGRTDDFLIGTFTAPAGTPAIGRNETLVPLRADICGEPTVRELLARTSVTRAEALRHPDFPFDALAGSRDPGRLPLVQAACTLTDPVPEPVQVGGLEFELLAGGEDTGLFDLAAAITDTPAALRVRLSYQVAVFDRATVERLAGHWRTTLAAMVSNPDHPVADLPLLSEAERYQILVSFNETAAEPDGNHDPQRAVAQHARATPDEVAAECAGITITYRELDARVNALAAYLLECGVEPDSRVALLLEPSIEYLVSVLAVMRAGGASVPLDADSPPHRLRMMIEDSGAGLVLTERALADRVANPVCLDEIELSAPDKAVAGPALPDSLAYIIFTSGSTGRPQGVAVTRRNLANYLAWVRTTLVPDASELLPVVSRLTFDGALKQLFPPLLAGTRVWLLPRDVVRDPAELTRQLAARDRVVVGCTPSLCEAILDFGDPAVQDKLTQSWSRALLGGEPLSRALVDRLRERYPHTQIWNVYGPTEITANSSAARVDRIDRPYLTAPIGGPIWNCTYYVLDERMRPVPIGVPGELFIGGTPVAREYVGRADLTADRFVPDPFGGRPGARLYRTGDLVRWLPDGTVEFIGRKDFQVKIRGMRIEPGEVEAALREHPAVTEAVVMARSDGPGDGRQYLAAYVRPGAGGIAEDEVRAFLRERVPEYLLPSTVTVLAEFPRMPNGKTDRRGLPTPVRAVRETVAPRTDGERKLVTIFEEVLGVSGIGVEDGFFELGGHSLLAARAAVRIADEFGVRLGVRAIFTEPTAAGLYGRIRQAAGSVPAEKQESLMELPDEQRAGAGSAITARPGATELVPLSFAQERLWFLAELEPESIAYSVPIVMELHGELDVPALEWTLGEIVRRHEVLRTVFVESGGAPRQLVLPAGEFSLPVVALPEDPEAAKELIARESAKPFDLARGPLFRGVLARTGARDHLLVLGVHHIVFDAWSHGVFNRELSALYTARVAGRTAGLPELTVQYADFALWQRQSDTTGELMDYWRAQLAGVSPVLQLPADHPRPADQSYRGDLVKFDLPAELVDRLRGLSRAHNVTMFMTVLAAFQIVLSAYTGRDDFLVGAPSANRGRTELDPLIGFFVNTLVLRADLRGDPTVAQLLDRVSETSLGAFEHQALPFEHLVEELAPARDLSYTPLVQVLFAFTGDDGTELTLPGLEVQTVRREDASAKFDLTLRVQVGAERSGAAIAYNRDLFDRDRIERLAGHLRTVLAGMVARPDAPVSEIPVVDDAERHRVLVEWNGFGGELEAAVCLHHLVEEQAGKRPDRIAVQFDDRRLTYRELDEQANEVAWRLLDAGVAADDVVGVCAERSLEMVVATLGVLKAGAGYLPLAPDHPDDRLRYMVEDAGVRAVVAQPEFSGRIDVDGVHVLAVTGKSRADRPAVPISPDNLAYVIYTSGSTGRPKGTHVSHHAISNNLLWMQRDWPLDETDRLLHKTLFTFDVSVKELFWPLLAGARLVLARPGGHRDPAYLRELIVEAGITVTHFVPSMLQAFLAEPGVEECRSLRLVMCGAEALSVRVQSEFFEKLSALLLHLYGPTEAAIAVTAWPCERGVHTERVPLGRPMPNCRIYVLDPNMSPVPAGVPGELYIAGVPLARGYAGRADTTAEKFVPDPFGPEPGGRLYRTGDVARWRPDGLLEFIGRADSQVKIRGLRIEPGEVEAVLGNEPGVAEAAVVARTDGPGPRLVAYLRPRAGAGITAASVREYLRERVPDYLVPADIVVLPEFPRLPNGKVDRNALPEPDRTAGETHVAARTPAERALAEIWGQVLKRAVVGVRDNFFDLGGDSLLSIQVVSKARRAGLVLTVRDMFRYQTIEELAATLKAPSVSEEPAATGPVPLTPAQHEILRGNPPMQVRTLEPAAGVSAGHVAEALQLLATQHDALRLTFTRTGTGWQQSLPDDEVAIPLREADAAPGEVEAELRRPVAPDEGPLVQAVLGRHDGRAFLVLAVHPLLVDSASWRFLLGDLHTALDALTAGYPVVLPPKTSSFRRWSLALAEYARAADLTAKAAHWTAEARPVPALPREPVAGPAQPVKIRLTPEDLSGISDVRGGALTAFLDAVCERFDAPVRVDVHTDGRDRLAPDVDVSRTVGRFATGYPVRAESGAVRTALAAGGITHGVLRHLRHDVTSRTLASAPVPELGFGDLDGLGRDYLLRLSVAPDGDGWTATWTHRPELSRSTVDELVEAWLDSLRGLNDTAAPSATGGEDPFVVLSSGGGPEVVLVHPVAGHLNGYQTLVRLLGDDVTLYGLMAAGLDGTGEPAASVPDMAERYLDALRQHGIGGPYRLAGWSFGGLVAFEMASRLARAGECVELVAAIDSAAPGTAKITSEGLVGMLFAEEVGRASGDGPIPVSMADVLDAGPEDIVALVAGALAQRHGDRGEDWVPEIGNLYRVFRANMLAAAAYRPEPYPGDLLSVVHSRIGADRTTSWPDFVTGAVTRYEIPGDHYSIMAEPHVHRLVEILRKHIGA